MITDEQFQKLMLHYRPTFVQWHKHITKHIKIEREQFMGEFQIVLFKTMTQFDVNKATAQDARFERYFMSSLRRMVNTLLRRASTKKRAAERRTVPFQLREHDRADTRADGLAEIVLREVIERFVRGVEDRDVAVLLSEGADGRTVCEELSMGRSAYRSSLRRLRSNSALSVACRDQN